MCDATRLKASALQLYPQLDEVPFRVLRPTEMRNASIIGSLPTGEPVVLTGWDTMLMCFEEWGIVVTPCEQQQPQHTGVQKC